MNKTKDYKVIEFNDVLIDEYLINVKKTLINHLRNFMEVNKLTKTQVALDLNTSRSNLDRILNCSNTSISLKTLLKVVRYVNKKLVISIEHME